MTNQAQSAKQQLIPIQHSPLVLEMAKKYGMDAERLITTLQTTYFKTSEPNPLSAGEIIAGLVICQKYSLDPFLREIHVTRAKGRLIVMVGIDGWIRIAQRTDMLDGMEFVEQFSEEGKIEAVICKVHRKDQSHPTTITAYMHEYARETEPWRAMPIRMLRHKAAKEALRYAFGIAGIDDEEPDELIPSGPQIRKSRSLNLGGSEPYIEQVPEPPLPEAPPMREPGQEG